MGLGTVTNVAHGMRAVNAALNAAGNSNVAKRSYRRPENDSSVAAIRKLQRAENPAIVRNTNGGITSTSDKSQRFAADFSKSLDMYREWYAKLSEKIAVGRFSPLRLRDQIEQLEEATDWCAVHHPDKNDYAPFWAQEEFKSASRGATDTRALAWLKDHAQEAMLSQKGVEPNRVLSLLFR